MSRTKTCEGGKKKKGKKKKWKGSKLMPRASLGRHGSVYRLTEGPSLPVSSLTTHHRDLSASTTIMDPWPWLRHLPESGQSYLLLACGVTGAGLQVVALRASEMCPERIL